ncbi:MAG TPA: serine/threonine-protein kinase [Planctomycetota bacterium]|nr:serine/threonine-protein kinase [Planctomycetota bacterium]
MPPALEDLVIEFLERLESSGAEEGLVLEELAALHPEQADQLRGRVAVLRDMGLLYLSSGERVRELPKSLGDFDFEELLGEGGMGVVYRATQRSMRRQVALKLMRPGFLDRPAARARFAREAEAVARLSHPGIIAVHVSGEEEGIPYLAMDFVAGVSLDRVLRAVAGKNSKELSGADFRRALVRESNPKKESAGREHATSEEGASLLFSGTWHEACLRVCRDVARALAHAHERGVLHRDVKPPNIMLTREGRVLLLDFGLASLVGDQAMTQSGAMVGSLPYMAPEQVEGDRDAIDARTDVYGLGVTLYQMLTLKSPHLDPDSNERTRARILDGRPASPRTFCEQLPKDAQTVVLVAMDRDPARRYQSAAAFAQDLDAVLEHRPIQARPAGALTHVARWAQRHPGAATAAALALCIATLGPSIYALQSARANKRLQEQLVRADRNYQRSLDALGLVTNVAVTELSDVPMAEPGRRKVLEGAVAFFREAAMEPGSSPEVVLERARAQVKLGDLCEDLGDLEGASAALESAVAAFQSAGVQPGSARAADFASAYRHLAEVCESRKRRDQALEFIDKGLVLAPVGQTDPKSSMQRAQLKALRAKLLRRSKKREEARSEFIALIDELGDGEDVANKEPAELAAWCHSELSELEDALGDATGRLAHLERALAIREGLSARDPSSRGTRHQLIVSLSNLGGAHSQLGDLKAALPLLERAAELGEKQIEEFPGLPEYRFNLSGVLINLGGVHYNLDDLSHARICMDRSREITSRLLETEPQRAEYRMHFIAASVNLIAFDLQERHYAATLERLDPFDAVLAELLQQSPGESNLVRNVQTNALNRIRAYWGLKQAADATRTAAGLLSCEDPKTLCNAASELGGVLEFEDLPQVEREQATETILDLLEAAKHRGASVADLTSIERLKSLQDHPRMRALVQE